MGWRWRAVGHVQGCTDLELVRIIEIRRGLEGQNNPQIVTLMIEDCPTASILELER